MWVLQSIFFRCVLPAGRGPDPGDAWSHVGLVGDRLGRWGAGECGQLWTGAMAGQERGSSGGGRGGVAAERGGLGREERNAGRCRSGAREGRCSRAVQALVSCGLAECSPRSLLGVRRRRPALRRAQPDPPEVFTPPGSFVSSGVSAAALSFPGGSGAGPSGVGPERFGSVLGSTSAELVAGALGALTGLVGVVAAGGVPQRRAFPLWRRACCWRGEGQRPAPGCCWRSFARGCGWVLRRRLGPGGGGLVCSRPAWCGCWGGAEAVARAVSGAVGVRPGSWVLRADLVNTCSSVDGGVVLGEVAARFPECFAWVGSCCGDRSWLGFGESVIVGAAGLHRGGPLAGLLFWLMLGVVVGAIEAGLPGLILNAWCLGGGRVVGAGEGLASAVDVVVREGESGGLNLSRAAAVLPPSSPGSVVWGPLGGVGGAGRGPLRRGVPGVRAGVGIVVLGALVGCRSFVGEGLSAGVEGVRAVVGLLPLVGDPRTEFVLLRSCLSLPRIVFVLRAVGAGERREELFRFDSAVGGALARLLGSTLSDRQWARAALPTAMGGLGLRSAADRAPAAHAVSFLAARSLLGGLLREDVEEPSLPQPLLGVVSEGMGEDSTVEALAGVSRGMAGLWVDLHSGSLLLQRVTGEGGGG